MTILGTSDADRATLVRRLAEPSHVVVVALCAAWCTTCREFRAAFGFALGGQALGFGVFDQLHHFFTDLFNQFALTSIGRNLGTNHRLIGLHTVQAF